VKDDGGYQETSLEFYISYLNLYNMIFSKTDIAENEMSKYIETSIEKIKSNILNYSIECLKNRDIEIIELNKHMSQLIKFNTTNYDITISPDTLTINHAYDLLCRLVYFHKFNSDDLIILAYLKSIFNNFDLSIDKQMECIICNIMSKTPNFTIGDNIKVDVLLNKYYFMSNFKYINEINCIKNRNSMFNTLNYDNLKLYMKKFDTNDKCALEYELIKMIEEHYPTYIHNMDDIVKNCITSKNDDEEEKHAVNNETETIEEDTEEENNDEDDVENIETTTDSDDDIDLAKEIDNELESDSE
jgi:hypothetical protein